MPEKDISEEAPLVNLDKLSDLASLYKFPLILAGIGIFLFTVSISLLVKSQRESAPVFFEEATGSSKTKIRIDIQGEVLVPGVYELAEDSRIIDALAKAGGLSAHADRDYLAKNLNQAAKLIDGGKIFIPRAGGTDSSQSKNLSSQSKQSSLGATTKTVSINTASQKELEALSGVGPVTAEKIIAGRPYQTVEELKTRKIIGSSLFEKLKDSLAVY